MKEKPAKEQRFLYALAKQSRGHIPIDDFKNYREIREKDDNLGSLTEFFTVVHPKIIEYIIDEFDRKSPKRDSPFVMGYSNFTIRSAMGKYAITKDLVRLEVSGEGWDGKVNLCTENQIRKFVSDPNKIVLTSLSESAYVDQAVGLVAPPKHLL